MTSKSKKGSHTFISVHVGPPMNCNQDHGISVSTDCKIKGV